VSYTLSKSMNNVGEFFFSSPIDPFDLSKAGPTTISGNDWRLRPQLARQLPLRRPSGSM